MCINIFIKLKNTIKRNWKSIEKPFCFFLLLQIIVYIIAAYVPSLYALISKLTENIHKDVYSDIIVTIASFDGVLYSLFFTDFLSKYKEVSQIFSNNEYVMKKTLYFIIRFTLFILIHFLCSLFCLYNSAQKFLIVPLFINFAISICYCYRGFINSHKIYSTKYFIEDLKGNIDEFF